MKRYKIGIVGSGKVAHHLSQVLLRRGHIIEWVYSRNLKQAKRLADKFQLGYSNKLGGLDTEIDYIIVAIKDDAIEKFMGQLNEAMNFEGIILHTSGSVSSTVAKNSFKHYGVFYPLQTFSDQSNINFEEIPICITANSKRVLSKIKQLAESISEIVVEIDDTQRFVLHISAVIACNFTNHMYHISEIILKNHHLDFSILRPLISETSRKIAHNFPSESQTGPAIRKDIKTIQTHLVFLEDYPDWKKLYKEISDDITRLKS